MCPCVFSRCQEHITLTSEGSLDGNGFVWWNLLQDKRRRGQSEPIVEHLIKANAVTPLRAVQNEYSIMQRASEKEIFALCEKLNIGFVAYSPMAGGFLSGTYSANTEFKGDDVRRVIIRFSKDNMEANQPLLDLLHQFAEEKGITPAQISLALDAS
ncbi:MAG: aldo/keto reductase [Treponema sp.]|nr:aldo/keto reductase [Treponema sp.]